MSPLEDRWPAESRIGSGSNLLNDNEEVADSDRDDCQTPEEDTRAHEEGQRDEDTPYRSHEDGTECKP